MRFELVINGQPVCIAGIKDYGVLTAILSWVLRDPAKYDANKHPAIEEYSEEELNVHLCGLLNNGEHVEWIKTQLQIGDEIRIKILGPGDIDNPLLT